MSSKPNEKKPTLEEAVVALNAINLLCQKMEGHFQDETLTEAMVLRKSKIVHHQIREIAEEWA